MAQADFLKYSMSQTYNFENAISAIETMVETVQPTLKEYQLILSYLNFRGEFYFENNALTKTYFETMYPLLEDKIRFYARLATVNRYRKKVNL
jgi:hypothetical protein